jgi:hypothetical protein
MIYILFKGDQLYNITSAGCCKAVLAVHVFLQTILDANQMNLSILGIHHDRKGSGRTQQIDPHTQKMPKDQWGQCDPRITAGHRTS